MQIQGYAIDESLDNDGVWRELKHGHKVKVAPLENPVHRKIKKQVETKYYGKRPDMARISEKARRQCNIEQMVRGCLRDWDIVKGEPFEMELAVATLLAYENRLFANAVIEEIVDETSADSEGQEEDLGNSPTTSSGKKRTAKS